MTDLGLKEEKKALARLFPTTMNSTIAG